MSSFLGAARMAGQAIPKGTFELLGSEAGAALGRGVASFTGVGDYVMNDIVTVDNMPKKSNNSVRRITHCEYIRDIVVPTNPTQFTPVEIPINPAAEATFPWLSQFAKLFTKYRFTQLIFEFRSSYSDYATGGTLGTIIMAPQYNVNQVAFNTKQQMEASAHAISTKPSRSIFCGFECDRKENNFMWYNVRPLDQEITPFTDPGNMTYATVGLPSSAGTVIGELFVHYTVELIEPILTLNTNSQLLGRSAYAPTSGTGILDTYPLGVEASKWASNIPGVPILYSMRVIKTDSKPNVNEDYELAVPATTATKWWFHNPGFYLISVQVYFTTPVPTAASGVIWFATLDSGTGAVQDIQIRTSADRTVHTYVTMVQTLTSDCTLQWVKNTAWTGLGSAVVANLTLEVVRLG